MADGGKVIIKIDGDDKGFKSAMSKTKDIAKTAAKGIAVGIGAASTAITAGFGAAIKVGSDFEAQMSTVSAISGASAEDMAMLGDKAKEMGIKTAFSATEAGQAMEYMAMAGWKTEDMLNGIEGIMNLAAASGEDLAATSDIVTDAMTAFGLAADQSGRFADVLAAASSNANTNVGLMGETFKYVAPVAGAMGFSIEDTAVAIGLMANAGIKGSQAGTALRATLSRLAKPPKEAAEAMDALKLSVTNSDGSFKTFNQIITELRSKFSTLTAEQKTSYAAMLGGQEAMSGLLAIVNASDNDFNKLTEAIIASAGSAEKMANVRLDNFQGQITLLKSSLEGLGVAVYESNNVALTGAIEQVKDYVNQLTEAFNNGGFSGLIEQAGVIFADMATKIAEQAPKLIEAAKNLIISFINALSENDEQIINAAIEIIYTLATAILELIPQIISLGGSLLQSLIDGMNEKLPGITTLIEAIGIAFASIKIGTTIQGIVTGFQQAQLSLALFSAQTNGANLAQAAFNGTLTVGETIVGLLTGKIKLAELAQLAMAKAQSILNAVMSANPIALVVIAITALVAAFVVLWNKSEAFRNFWINLWETIKNAAITAINFVKENWKEIGLFLVNPIAGAIALLYKLNPKFKAWVDKIILFFKELPKNLLQIGKDLVVGLWNGIKEKKDWLLNKIDEWCGNILNGIKAFFGIHSPSTVMRDEVGKMITEGIAVGIEKSTPTLEEAIKTQKQTIVDNYKGIAQAAIDSIDEVAKAQENYSNKLKGYASLYDTSTGTLTDYKTKTEQLKLFSQALEKVQKRGDVPIGFFNELREMPIDEGIKFATALANAPDKIFDEYIGSWKEYQEEAEKVSKTLYSEEAKTAGEEIQKSFENFDANLEEQGKQNAQAWGQGFIEQIKQVMPNVMGAINSAFSGIVTGNQYAYAGAGTSNTYYSTYNIQPSSGESTQQQLWALKNAEFLKEQRGY